MSFELVAYEKLKLSIIDSVKTLILHHDKEYKIIPDKLEEAVKAVVPNKDNRQSQALALLKAIDLLEKTPSESNALILNAFAYYIHQQIFHSYKYSSPENSAFFNSLNTALDLNKENEPSQNDLVGMYEALAVFIKGHVYVGGDARKGYLADQPFATTEYDVRTEIDTLEKITLDLNVKIRDKAEELNKKIAPEKAKSSPKKEEKSSSEKSSSSWNLLSLFGSGSSSKPAPKKTGKTKVVKTEVVKSEEEPTATGPK